VTLDIAVIAGICERFVKYFTAGLMKITFRMLNAIIMVLLGTDAPALGILRLVPVPVRAVVRVRNIFLLWTGQFGLELFIDRSDILF
jgi:hypothetical protein